MIPETISATIYDGKNIFACLHEFVCTPYGFWCHKCDHLRYELPIAPTKDNRRLYFFPANAIQATS